MTFFFSYKYEYGIHVRVSLLLFDHLFFSSGGPLISIFYMVKMALFFRADNYGSRIGEKTSYEKFSRRILIPPLLAALQV